jgi:hypothetical protein
MSSINGFRMRVLVACRMGIQTVAREIIYSIIH